MSSCGKGWLPSDHTNWLQSFHNFGTFTGSKSTWEYSMLTFQFQEPSSHVHCWLGCIPPLKNCDIYRPPDEVTSNNYPVTKACGEKEEKQIRFFFSISAADARESLSLYSWIQGRLWLRRGVLNFKMHANFVFFWSITSWPRDILSQTIQGVLLDRVPAWL